MLDAVRARRARTPPRTSRWPASSARSGCSPRRRAAAPSSTSPRIPRPATPTSRRLADLLPRLRDGHRGRAGAPPLAAGAAVGARCGALDRRARRAPALARRRGDHGARRAVVTGLGRADRDDLHDRADHRRRRGAVRPRHGRLLRDDRAAHRRGPRGRRRACSCCPRPRSAATSSRCTPTTSSRRRRSTATAPSCARVMELAGDMVVCVGFCEDGGDGVAPQRRRLRDRRRLLGLHRKVHMPLRRGPHHDARRPPRRVRHAGRPDRDADLLRQGVPRGGAHAGARRRRGAVLPCRAWPRSATNAAATSRRPPVAPRRALGPLARGGELARRRLGQPDRRRSARCASSAARGSSSPSGDVARRDRHRAAACRSRRSTSTRRSSAPAGRSRRSATCAPTSTASPRRCRRPDLMPTSSSPSAGPTASAQRCMSPSRSIERLPAPGGATRVDEFVRRAAHWRCSAASRARPRALRLRLHGAADAASRRSSARPPRYADVTGDVASSHSTASRSPALAALTALLERPPGRRSSAAARPASS